MTLVNSVVAWLMKKRIHQIELFQKFPNEVQEEWFEQLIASAENTEWGKHYHYREIENIRQFNRKDDQRRAKCTLAVGNQMVCQIIGYYKR